MEVVMIKQGGNCCLCRACYYLKRGSLNNMKISELITNLNDNDSFREKTLASPVFYNKTRQKHIITRLD